MRVQDIVDSILMESAVGSSGRDGCPSVRHPDDPRLKMEPQAPEPKKRNPGSDEALDAGCRCAVMDNAHGRRTDERWSISMDCPLHGETNANR